MYGLIHKLEKKKENDKHNKTKRLAYLIWFCPVFLFASEKCALKKQTKQNNNNKKTKKKPNHDQLLSSGVWFGRSPFWKKTKKLKKKKKSRESRR